MRRGSTWSALPYQNGRSVMLQIHNAANTLHPLVNSKGLHVLLTEELQCRQSFLGRLIAPIVFAMVVL